MADKQGAPPPPSSSRLQSYGPSPSPPHPSNPLPLPSSNRLPFHDLFLPPAILPSRILSCFLIAQYGGLMTTGSSSRVVTIVRPLRMWR